MFKFSKRSGEIGKLNTRIELHGTEKKPAVDIPLKFQATKRDLDMLCPIQNDEKYSDMIYHDGQLLTPYLSPLTIHRKPSDVEFKIYDEPTKPKSVLAFGGAHVKDIEVVLLAKQKFEITLKVQFEIEPDKHAARLMSVMGQTREFEMISRQDDLYESDEPEGDAQEGAQGELPTGAEPDDDDEDEE